MKGSWTSILSAATLALVMTILLFGSDRAAAQDENRPGAPASVSTELQNRNEINITWTAPTDNGGSDITGYEVSVGPVGDIPTIVSVGADDRAYIATDLAYATRYEIRARPVTRMVGAPGTAAISSGQRQQRNESRSTESCVSAFLRSAWAPAS